MKPSFTIRLASCTALISLFFAAGPALAEPAITLEPQQVGPHTYFFEGASGMATEENKGFMSNAGFIVTTDGVLVFDTLGTPALGQAMVDAIRDTTDQPISRVIVSHYHADHVYGLQAFKAAGAEVWAHEAGKGYSRSEDALERLEQRRRDLSEWVDDDTQLIEADHWLTFSEGNPMSFEMGDDTFEIYDVSGTHSAGDIMLYHAADGVLFAGDLYFTGRIPYVEDADSKAWLHAMDSMLDMDPELVVPGHGKSSTNTVQDMELTRDYLLFLRQEMGTAVEDMTDFEEAYASTDWSEFEGYPAFDDANRINAYGQYLRMERESLDDF